MKSLLKAIFYFFPMSTLTLLCCLNVVSNFLVAASFNSRDTCIPTISLFAIVSSIRACAIFNILHSNIAFQALLHHSSIHLLSYLIYVSFIMVVPVLKIFSCPLQVVPFPIFLAASFPLLHFLVVLCF